MERNRKRRENELRLMLKDPVQRIVLERKFFVATGSMPPQQDDDLLNALMEVDEKVFPAL